MTTMPLGARVGDIHTCPVASLVPHVGGPLLPPGAPNVTTTLLPSAVAGESAFCVGPLDTIMVGSPTVFLHNMMAGRVNDPTTHGGIVSAGCPTVIIGGQTAVVTMAGGV